MPTMPQLACFRGKTRIWASLEFMQDLKKMQNSFLFSQSSEEPSLSQHLRVLMSIMLLTLLMWTCFYVYRRCIHIYSHNYAKYIQILVAQTVQLLKHIQGVSHVLCIFRDEQDFNCHALFMLLSTPSKCGQGFYMQWTVYIIKTPRAKARVLCGRIPIMPHHFQPPSLDTIHSDEGEGFAGLDDVTGSTSSDGNVDQVTAVFEIPAFVEHPTYEDYEDVSHS